VIGLAAIASPAQAQGVADGSWHYRVEPYVMFANMDGTTGLDELPDASVAVTASDIFSDAQIGGMLYAEAHNTDWAFGSDFTYMKLAQDGETNRLIGYSRVTVQQLGWELAALRRVAPWLELGLAAQLNSIQSTLNLSLNTPGGAVPREDKLTETWVDPSLLARVTCPLSQRWYVQGRFNVGGFDVGSEFYYQAQLYAGYHISNLMETSFGYRVIGVDYEKGSGADRFLYHVTTFGPVVRFAFNF
jgi:hypothetical protein